MEKLFFFFDAGGMDSYGFHANFLAAESACMYAFLIALVIGVMISAAYYLGCCNSRKNIGLANIGTWFGALALSAVITYCVSDFCIIGMSNVEDDTSIFYTNSFYSSMESYYQEEYADNTGTPEELEAVMQEKDDIIDDLNAGGDIRPKFDLMSVAWCIFFFYLSSFLFKKKTINGSCIPHK